MTKSDLRKIKVLIIDDTEENLYVFEEILSQSGYEVFTSDNGADGIKKATKELPDLIICDIMMPEMDGYEVMRHIREHHETQTIPFVFLSAKNDPNDIREGMMLGADDYITKPVPAKELLRAVETRLSRKKIFDAKIKDLTKSITYSLPHELQTPLTAIIGFSRFLNDNYDTIRKKDIKEISDSLLESAERLKELTEKLLTITNIDLISRDTESLRLLRSATAIIGEKIFRDIAAKKKNKYNLKNSDDIFRIEECSVMITGDNLKKIAEELIDNAYKFSDKTSGIEVRGFIDKDDYVIAVTDFGKGMSKKEIASINEFNQFGREKHEKRGTGLGLAVVQKLLDLHEGKLQIKSFPEKGTTFLVSLKKAVLS